MLRRFAFVFSILILAIAAHARPPQSAAPNPAPSTTPISELEWKFKQQEFAAMNEWMKQRFCEVSGMNPADVEVQLSDKYLAAIVTSTRRGKPGVVLLYNPFELEPYFKNDNLLHSILRHEHGHEVLDAGHLDKAAKTYQNYKNNDPVRKKLGLPDLTLEEAVFAVTKEFSIPIEHHCDIFATLKGLQAGESQQPFMDFFKQLPGTRNYFSHSHPAGLDRAHTIEVTTEWAKRHKEWMPKGPDTLTQINYDRAREFASQMQQYRERFNQWAESPEIDGAIRQRIDQAKEKILSDFWRDLEREFEKRKDWRASRGTVKAAPLEARFYTTAQKKYAEAADNDLRSQIYAQFEDRLKRMVSKQLPRGAKGPEQEIIQHYARSKALGSRFKEPLVKSPYIHLDSQQAKVSQFFERRMEKDLERLYYRADIPKLLREAPEDLQRYVRGEKIPRVLVLRNWDILTKGLDADAASYLAFSNVRTFDEFYELARKDSRVFTGLFIHAGLISIRGRKVEWDTSKREKIRSLIRLHRESVRNWIQTERYAADRIKESAKHYLAMGADPSLFLAPKELATLLETRALVTYATADFGTRDVQPYLLALREQEAQHLRALRSLPKDGSKVSTEVLDSALDFLNATHEKFPGEFSTLYTGLQGRFEHELQVLGDLPVDKFHSRWRSLLQELSSRRYSHSPPLSPMAALLLTASSPNSEIPGADQLLKRFPKATIPPSLKKRLQEERIVMIRASIPFWDNSPTLKRLALRQLSLDERKKIIVEALSNSYDRSDAIALLDVDNSTALLSSLPIDAKTKIKASELLAITPQAKDRLLQDLRVELLEESLAQETSLLSFAGGTGDYRNWYRTDQLTEDYWLLREKKIPQDRFLKEVIEFSQSHETISADLTRKYLPQLPIQDRVTLFEASRGWTPEEQDVLFNQILRHPDLDYPTRLKLALKVSDSPPQREKIWEELSLPALRSQGYNKHQVGLALTEVFDKYPEVQFGKIDSVANTFQLNSGQIEELEDHIFPDKKKGRMYKVLEGIRSNLLTAGIEYEDKKDLKKINEQRIDGLRYLLGLKENYHFSFRPVLDRMPSHARESLILDLISPHDPKGLWHPDNARGRSAIMAILLEGIPTQSEPYAKLVLGSYLKALDRSPEAPRAHLFLTRALAATRESKQDNSKIKSPLIQVIRRIVDAKGGLWAKITQVLAGDPSIVPEAADRTALQKANDQVDVPTRKRALNYLEKALGSEIQEVTEVRTPPLGSGSMNVTVDVKFKNGESYAARMVRDDPDLEAQFERQDLKATVQEIRQGLLRREYAVDPVVVHRMANGIEEATELLADSIQSEADLRHDRKVLKELGAETLDTRSVYDGFERDLKARTMIVREAKVLKYSEGGANPVRILLSPIVRDIRKQSPPPTQAELVRAYQAMYRAEIRALFEKGLADADGHKGNWLVTRDPSNPKLLIVHRIDLSQPVRLNPKELDDLRAVFSGLTRRIDPGLVGIRQVDNIALTEAFLGLIATPVAPERQGALLRATLESLQSALKTRRATNAPEFLDEWRSALQLEFGERLDFKSSVRFAKKALLAAQQIAHSTDLTPASLKAMKQFQQRTFGQTVLRTSYPRLVFSALVSKLRGFFVRESVTSSAANTERSSYYRDLLARVPTEAWLKSYEFESILEQQPAIKAELVQAARRMVETTTRGEKRPAVEFLRQSDPEYLTYAKQILNSKNQKTATESLRAIAQDALRVEKSELYSDLLNANFHTNDPLPQSWIDYLKTHLSSIMGGSLIHHFEMVREVDRDLEGLLAQEILKRGPPRHADHLRNYFSDPTMKRELLRRALDTEDVYRMIEFGEVDVGTSEELWPSIREGNISEGRLLRILSDGTIQRGFLEAALDSPKLTPEARRIWIARVTSEAALQRLPVADAKELLNRIPSSAGKDYESAQRAMKHLGALQFASSTPGKSGVLRLPKVEYGSDGKFSEIRYNPLSVTVDGVTFTRGKSAIDDRVVDLLQEPRKTWVRPDLAPLLKSLKGPQHAAAKYLSDEKGLWASLLASAYDRPWTNQEWLALGRRYGPENLKGESIHPDLLTWGLRHVASTKMRPDVLREIERLAIKGKELSPKERTFFLQQRPLGKFIQAWSRASNPSEFLRRQNAKITVTGSDLKILEWIAINSPIDTGVLPLLRTQDDLHHLGTLLVDSLGHTPEFYIVEGSFRTSGGDSTRLRSYIQRHLLTKGKDEKSTSCKKKLQQNL